MPLTQIRNSNIDSSAQYTGFKNRIINGDMRIDQRNAGAAVTGNDAFPVDRFKLSYGNSSGAFSAQQSTIAPVGFTNSLKYTTTTADTSLGAVEYAQLYHAVEGLNVADFGWGTANAQPVTLSFWCRSSVTGTFGGSIRNSAGNRSYPFSYTISVADTWEYKSVTIAGDTTGTWLTTNGVGMYLGISMGAGSTLSGTAGSWQAANLLSATGAVNLIATLNATFYITGVQLEKGSAATSFDYRPYGTELALCQRYYWETPNETAWAVVGQGQHNTTSASIVVTHPVPMRSVPTVSALGTNAGSWAVQMGSTNINTGSTAFSGAWGVATTSRSVWMDFGPISGGTAGYALTVFRNNQLTSNKNGCLSFSAEL
jgi:hypothetical protein